MNAEVRDTVRRPERESIDPSKFDIPCSTFCGSQKPGPVTHESTAALTMLLPASLRPSRNQIMHDLAMHIGQPKIPPGITVSQPGVIQAQLVQNRRL